MLENNHGLNYFFSTCDFLSCHRWLFYSTRDLDPTAIGHAGIWRANMDGSDPVNIGGTDHMIPNGIAIDFEGKSFVFLNLQI